jgi:hypothetical protein
MYGGSLSFSFGLGVPTLDETSSASPYVIKCDKVEDAYSTSLYYWSQGSTDGPMSNNDIHVCRYDEYAAYAPECPAAACIWSTELFQCEQCAEDWRENVL